MNEHHDNDCSHCWHPGTGVGSLWCCHCGAYKKDKAFWYKIWLGG